MTEMLKQLMHEQASAPHFDPVDLDALTRVGDRRVRRRRFGSAVAGVAAVAVLATATTLASDREDETAPVVDTPAVQQQLTWSAGSTIHAGDTSLETGRDVSSFVRTSVGYAMTDDAGNVLSVRGDDVTEVGTVDAEHPFLVSDPDGPLTGWVEVVDGQPGFMVHDQETGATTRYDDATARGMGTLADEADAAYFYAIDGRTAYWRDRRGAVAVDLDTGDVRVVDAKALNGFDIAAVRDGLIAFSGQGTTIGTSRTGGVRLPEAYGTVGVFSPDLAYYSSDADEPSVWDLETRERVRLQLDGYSFAVGYEWLDADTLAVLGLRNQKAPFELLSCAVPEGSCTAEVELPGKTPGAFALPVGQGGG